MVGEELAAPPFFVRVVPCLWIRKPDRSLVQSLVRDLGAHVPVEVLLRVNARVYAKLSPRLVPVLHPCWGLATCSLQVNSNGTSHGTSSEKETVDGARLDAPKDTHTSREAAKPGAQSSMNRYLELSGRVAAPGRPGPLSRRAPTTAALRIPVGQSSKSGMRFQGLAQRGQGLIVRHALFLPWVTPTAGHREQGGSDKPADQAPTRERSERGGPGLEPRAASASFPALPPRCGANRG